MSRNLRGELAGSGIGVSVLCPGGVDTGIWQAARNRPAERGGPETYEWPDRLARSRSIGPLEVGRHVLRAIHEKPVLRNHPPGAARGHRGGRAAKCSTPSIGCGRARLTDARLTHR